MKLGVLKKRADLEIKMSDLFKKLTIVQNELKAPKSQYNNFGKYPYRNCEDILEAVKPLLLKHELCLTVSDRIVDVGERFYVQATVKIGDGQSVHEVFAYARECDSKKGMDDAQLTGATSSYARKYALNGLFLIDDTKDADSMDNSKPAPSRAKPKYTSFIFDADKAEITGKIGTGEQTADQIIINLEKKYTVGDGAKAAIRAIK